VTAARSKQIALFGGLVLAFIILLRNVWAGDDAFITLRVVDNLFHGYGLTWNVVERVQVYTHPLWLLWLSALHLIVRDGYLLLAVASLLCSLAAVTLILTRFATDIYTSWLAVALLLLSKAWVDYASSGLENPLTYLLLTVFFLLFLKGDPEDSNRLLKLAFLASLLALNRLDNLLFVAPALLYALSQQERRLAALGQLALGFLPLLAWEVFSLIYYGFPLPNTYYAKLTTGLPQAAQLRQGAAYFLNSFNWDPLTWLAIGIAFAVALRQRHERNMLALLGAGLYFFYVIWIGGDFMSGRFFAAIFLVAVLVLLNSDLTAYFALHNPRARSFALLTLLLVGLSANAPPLLLSRAWLNQEFEHGIADEKLFYYQDLGWLNRSDSPIGYIWGQEGIVEGEDGALGASLPVGLLGYYSGPELYLLDEVTLGDPLRARLPVVGEPRVGHYIRPIPRGYLATIQSGFSENRIEDPDLHAYYDRLLLVIQGQDLFAPERLRAILDLNLGHYDHLLQRYLASDEWAGFVRAASR
jgi:arabinofuranosyltransferase